MEETNAWRRERSQLGCCRLQNTHATLPWVSVSHAQLPPSTTTMSPEEWIIYFIGAIRANATAEAPGGPLAKVIAALPVLAVQP